MNGKKKKFGVPRRGDDGLKEFIGVLLAPKSLYPCAVWASDNEGDGVTLTSLNKKRFIGAGYFGNMEPSSECTRQHMLPGLATDDDQGEGLGTALYLGGVLLIAGRTRAGWGRGCTFSVSEADHYMGLQGRTSDADMAWESMKRHDLAWQESIDTTEPFQREVDPDDLNIDNEVAEYLLEHSFEGANEVQIDEMEYFKVRGDVETSIPIDVLAWETLRTSGLMLFVNRARFTRGITVDGGKPTRREWVSEEDWGKLEGDAFVEDTFDEESRRRVPREDRIQMIYPNLNYPTPPAFDNDTDFVPPPPEALARADWSETPKQLLLSILLQCSLRQDDVPRKEYMATVYKAAKSSGAKRAEGAMKEILEDIEFMSRQMDLPFDPTLEATVFGGGELTQEMVKSLRRNPGRGKRFKVPRISKKTERFLRTYDTEFRDEFMRGNWA